MTNRTPRCICDFTAYTIDFHFRGRDGKNVKSWHQEGGVSFGEVIHWTIREVLLVKLRQSRAEVDRLPIYFQQLDDAGIYLNNMIKGGTNSAHIHSFADSTDKADLPELYIESDSDFVDYDEAPNLEIDYPLHWTLETLTHRDLLLKCLVEYLMEQFKGDPSYPKFEVIHELDPDYQEPIYEFLRSEMIHSRNAANCALRVFLADHLLSDMEKVIKNTGHLFQPRDYLILQGAATVLARFQNYRAFTVDLVESQLVDVLECTQAALAKIWKGGDQGKQARMLLDEILSLSSNDPMRAAKISEWKEIVFTAVPETSEIFEAMFGFGRDDDDDDDDDDGSGACSDAREQSPSGSVGEVDRKLLSKRWNAWMEVGWSLLRGNPNPACVFHRVEKRMYEMFPWMRLREVRNHVVKRSVFPNQHPLEYSPFL